MHRGSFFGTLAGAISALVSGKVASADDFAHGGLICTKECRWPFNPGPCRLYEDGGLKIINTFTIYERDIRPEALQAITASLRKGMHFNGR